MTDKGEYSIIKEPVPDKATVGPSPVAPDALRNAADYMERLVAMNVHLEKRNHYLMRGQLKLLADMDKIRNILRREAEEGGPVCGSVLNDISTILEVWKPITGKGEEK